MEDVKELEYRDFIKSQYSFVSILVLMEDVKEHSGFKGACSPR